MESIVLRTDLHKQLSRHAEDSDQELSKLVNQAVEQYLCVRHHAKLDQEIAAYETMHEELRNRHLGQWVATHEQRLVDHDKERQALFYRSVRATFGRTSVLIRQVAEHPIEEVLVRTPSTGKLLS